MVSELLINFHLPFLVIAIVIGYQLTLHFFITYYKKKKEDLSLNKVLLAYGSLYGALMTTTLIRLVNLYFLEDKFLKMIFVQISYMFVAIGALIFLYFLMEKSIDVIISNKITKLLFIIAIILSLLMLIIRAPDFQIILVLIAITLGGMYLIPFHYNLLSLSSGIIRKRLILISIGNIIMVIGMILEADEFLYRLPYDLQIGSMISSVPVFVFGELIVYLGVYKFPAFLEFDWKEHLISFYVINNNTLNLLYKHSFGYSLNDKVYNEITEKLSKGIIGIDSIVAYLSKSEKKVKRIVQDDLVFLISKGNIPEINTAYVLIIDRDMESFPFFLNQIKNKFEYLFRNVLLHLEVIKGNEELVFSGYTEIIEDLLK